MKFCCTTKSRIWASAVLIAIGINCFGLGQLASRVCAQELEPYVKPNYRQAAQYSSRYLRQFLYDTSVRPNWIGETDSFWYSFRTSDGTNYYRVDPAKGKKEMLFDRVKLGAKLGMIIKKPVDPKRLPISSVRLNDEGTEITFTAERKRYTYNLANEKLELAKKPENNATPEVTVPPQFRGNREDFLRIMRSRGITPRGSRANSSFRVFSPDRKTYVFAQGHNLFMMELPEGYDGSKAEKDDDKEKKDGDAKKDGEKSDDDGKDGKSDKIKDDKKKTSDEQKSESDKKSNDKDEDKDSKKSESDEKDAKQDDQDEKKSKDDDKKDVEKKEKVEEDKSDKDEKQKKEDEKSKDEKSKDEKDSKKEEDKKKEDKKDGEKSKEDSDKDSDDKDADEKDKEIPIPKVRSSMDRKAVQITKDGKDKYSFAGRATGIARGGSRQTRPISDKQKTRPSVRWSKDSKAFYVTRRDSRDVKELWVINSLANPRPTLESYPYPMPGDEKIRKSELYYFNVATKKIQRVEPKWKDEGYRDIRFGETGDELRFIRSDRLLRNIEYCVLNTKTGETKCLLEEGFENAYYVPSTIRYLEESEEMIWWSEQSGWAHFYLYDLDGNLKNPITSGEFRASRIVKIDEKNRTLYFRGNAREPGENVYYNHLYRVRFDGTNLKLMDPDHADHTSTLSPSNQFTVDNCSRVDMPPVSILRDVDGKEIMKLEQSDMTRLKEVGWSAPETFVVKAADGVTDLYGNMWKPFDFDPKKKYPIIAHVYPGPQQEGTRHTFSATAGEQQLAQLGFIVIQSGHRGGAPYRSKSYSAYGYFNLRDYALQDKKATIEQLAQRFNFIDIERVGIYGHSGGGFMTAAALLREPYNDFFKVGVSTAGNHDNNIYNNSWSERYHGLKVTKARTTKKKEDTEKKKEEEKKTLPYDYQRGLYDVSPGDHFYEFEVLNDGELEELGIVQDQAFWDNLSSSDNKLFSDSPELTWSNQDDKKSDDKKSTQEDKEKDKDKSDKDQESKDSKSGKDSKQGVTEEGDKKKEDGKDDDKKSTDKDEKEKKESDDKKKDKKDEKVDFDKKFAKTKFEIKVPTNAELADNLKGHLFLVHGELDNNVHPANTLRLVDALIKANKRFDMLYLPATRHGFGQYQPYVTQRMYEYFAEHLLNDYQNGADIGEKAKADGRR